MDLLEKGDEGDVRDRFLVVLDPAVALGRAVVIVERHAWRDDVEDGRAPMGDCSLDEWDDLLSVPAERARHKRAAEGERDSTRVDGLEGVDRAFLLHRPKVRCGRELALGQSIR